MAAYDNSFSGDSDYGKYAAPPLPQYMELNGITFDGDGDAGGIHDVCYKLLKLYCDRTEPINSILNPPSLTGDPLDYSLRSERDLVTSIYTR